ncbi:HET domain-containing protein [Candidatus Bathyarchaeota archaeon]|nr:HET domain-containing protein [Candidatus Bathyarchaeota archaeon]
MWLINAQTLRLEYFLGRAIPDYAILSHTWDDDEVSFADFNAPSDVVRAKKGYVKIRETCRLALQHQLSYAWVDTCCIDKSSSAELTESINSMYEWYAKASICFAFLHDVVPESQCPFNKALASCRWFTRGWTLQETIAPRDISFYDGNWEPRGTKLGSWMALQAITGVPGEVLRDPEIALGYSVSTRMSWAAGRDTTRVEDMAYCLLGLFGISMPMIYGEGRRAFRRLQDEIIRQSNDLSILAWDKNDEHADPFAAGAIGISALADSPASFEACDAIRRPLRAEDFSAASIGLQFNNTRLYWRRNAESNTNQTPAPALKATIYLLPLAQCHRKPFTPLLNVFLPLRKIQPDMFVRCGNLVWDYTGEQHGAEDAISLQLHSQSLHYYPSKKMYISLADTVLGGTEDTLTSSLRNSIHFPLSDEFRIVSAVPPGHWDHRCQVFFSSTRSASRHVALAVRCHLKWNGSEVPIILCIQPDTINPSFPDYKIVRYTSRHERFFRHEDIVGRSVHWQNLEYEWPDIAAAEKTLDVDVGDEQLEVKAYFSYRWPLFSGPFITGKVPGGYDVSLSIHKTGANEDTNSQRRKRQRM